MSDHYTAILNVEKVTDEKPPEINGYRDVTRLGTPRIVEDVAKIVVRAETLEQLRERIRAHVALIE